MFRGCGEYRGERNQLRVCWRAIPRMWGSRGWTVPARLLSASIPTGVGEPDGRRLSGQSRGGYPHGCGGAARWGRVAWQVRGLSPRVWGGPRRRFRRLAARGSIPTGVGEPNGVALANRVERVYPHGCGGAALSARLAISSPGLSPRVWGSHAAKADRAVKVGSIPTGVGEPPSRWIGRMRTRVYPHGCGGASLIAAAVLVGWGLSPRVWGSPWAEQFDTHICGSIPTGVGEPRSSCLIHPLPWVYPHGCGGAALAGLYTDLYWGLSPRVWGSPRGADRAATGPGSIPTGVGEPCGRQPCPGAFGVYPHGCGGAAMSDERAIDARGLSPRVWGSHMNAATNPKIIGSIPTGVGEPIPRDAYAHSNGVYPHGCGGASTAVELVRSRSGLSPRVWGSLLG